MNVPSRRTVLLRAASVLAAGSVGMSAWAQLAGTGRTQVELSQLQVQRSDEGLLLNYAVRFELPHDVEDALLKGVAVVFSARAEVFRERWYWYDRSRAVAERHWRLTYQPLTRRWRVSVEGLSQHYGSLSEALAVMQRGSRWRIMDQAPANDERDHYVEFSFQLDRDELPRPLQIGLSDQSEWTIAVARRVPISLAR
ncbi:MAG TPA: DUF4390 domain-containing protein [Aquabacterium sp.]|uniref:DUF4390 domain-containing protein n=1 Tax=Aquabacterium sp. TaxID=1872578 RepID=UPI002E2F2DA7|nr:DUF4390 domain-containing protein [Aquabacterium sp.]HEX5373627.1 DUF4390 domain-containing protein [Aquabacterium sp.]